MQATSCCINIVLISIMQEFISTTERSNDRRYSELVKRHYKLRYSTFILQWSYGITLWEVFSGGKTPYPGVDPPSLVRLLDRGERMSKPDNAACNEEMYVDYVTLLYTMKKH